MSYAARLVAMSRGSVRMPPRSHAAEIEHAREEHGELEVGTRAPATPPAPTREPAAPQPIAPSPPPSRLRMPVRESEPATTTPTRVPAAGREIVEREIVEREIVEHEHTTPRPRALPEPVVVAPAIVERAALPPQAQWLADDPVANDPLVANADTEALRELMRSVRRWTASPPTPVPDRAAVPEQPGHVAPAGSPTPEPTQVSIGNVVITVEDAPPSPNRRDTSAPARSTSDRMARNHIRGG